MELGPPAGPRDAQDVLVLDGSFVHNVGNLWVNITNWGLIGSEPGSLQPFSSSPSAMWPAGSGVEYLYAAGLWVGALKGGLPAVSTGAYRSELRPDPNDPLDTIYRTYEGQPHGNRYPAPDEDDDHDGKVNEDPLNGRDDDGDGLVDEDFAAISRQEFRCEMRDDTPELQELPDHQPLDVSVVQESFQWDAGDLANAVGFQWTIENIGQDTLNDVYLAVFADADVGPRGIAGAGSDDLAGYLHDRVRGADGSYVPLDIAYMYDADGDNGLTPGYIGVVLLGTTTDFTGEHAPASVGVRSFQIFGGSCPFDPCDGTGGPPNDAQRYDVMSRAELDPSATDPGQASDYSFLLSVGPFDPLAPGQQLQLQAALVVGAGLDGMKRAAAAVALAWYGAWFNRDGDPASGVKGRETKVCQSDLGPPGPGNPIFSLQQDCEPSSGLIHVEDLDPYGCIYLNADCPFEASRGATNCTLDGTGVDEQVLAGCTGVLGREFHVPWITDIPPESPGMRVWETHDRVHLFWDDRSELATDLQTGARDFEGYQVWRAEGWTRPQGSSVRTGPGPELWRLIGTFDVVDSARVTRRLSDGSTTTEVRPLGANTGLDEIRYVPAVLRPGSPQAGQFAELASLVDRIVQENSSTVTRFTRIRYRDDKGELTSWGTDYPELANWTCCTDHLDTLVWGNLGVQFYQYVDRDVRDGFLYFHAVTAFSFAQDPATTTPQPTGAGAMGNPQSNFAFTVPRSLAQSAADRERNGANIYVVPNPATRQALAEFSQLAANSGDLTGVRIEFRNLPATRNRVRIFTLSGDLVAELWHDGSAGNGSLAWNLVTDGGQVANSGIYLYSVESADKPFDRFIGRFVIVR